ncbi:hypothetical protein EDB83DRAFT_2228254 [Lactarius deliciosus]|nr:hypothetical protein EDB83DRAFT_2228254 [Lactarius deliciosus]
MRHLIFFSFGSSLHSTSYWRKIDVVQLLLEHGASTNVEASTGATPLHSASLGEHGSQEDGVCIGAWRGRERRSSQTPIDSATRNHRFKLSQLLPENAVAFHAQRARAS